jgi:GT2 family glycosyltransferase
VNPILVPTHNGLELIKKAVHSFNLQDIPTEVHVIDNASTDGTWDWVSENVLEATQYFENVGVSLAWNNGLTYLFRKFDHVLVCNADVELPPNFYSTLLSFEQEFVSGVSVDKVSLNPPYEINKFPDFSAFLVRKSCWLSIGPFDSSMKMYASDCDWGVRAHRIGIQLHGSNMPFYHERSSTLRLAPPEERAMIERQANMDRQVFRWKYGCIPGEPEYDKLFE